MDPGPINSAFMKRASKGPHASARISSHTLNYTPKQKFSAFFKVLLLFIAAH